MEQCSESDLGAGVPDGSLDLVFLADVLHHLPNAAAMLRAVHRALKPGGRVVVLENDRAKYMEAVARSHPQQFNHMLRENIKARAAKQQQQQQQQAAHAHAHGHGQDSDHAHAHGHSHACDHHQQQHSHGHAYAHGGGGRGCGCGCG